LEQRSVLYGTICISQEDVLFEQWLGSKRVIFLPRTIAADYIDRNPLGKRIGCVSTLNHGPNLHGLRLLLEELDKSCTVQLRLVGGPSSIGNQLASQYRCLEYLGPLDNDQLRQEAASWWAFVNPIFCVARGASTKVATALGWGLPVLTTTHGKRGYVWPDSIQTYETPQLLAEACQALCNGGGYGKFDAYASQLLQLAPTLSNLKASLEQFMLA
jgi:hypothetical protein